MKKKADEKEADDMGFYRPKGILSRIGRSIAVGVMMVAVAIISTILILVGPRTEKRKSPTK